MSEHFVVQKTLSYIEENLQGDLSFDTIAENLNYSKYYIARTFSRQVNCTLYKYIQGRRLTEAAKKLTETEEPIIDIAYEASYNSQQAFTLAFHQVYQCTPQEYRRNGVFLPKQPKVSLKAHTLTSQHFISRTEVRLAA